MKRILTAVAMTAIASFGVFGLMAHDSNQAVAQTASTSSDELVKSLSSTPSVLPAPKVAVTTPDACGVGGFVDATVTVESTAIVRNGTLVVIVSAERQTTGVKVQVFNVSEVGPNKTFTTKVKVPTAKGAWSVRASFDAPGLARTSDCSCKVVGNCKPRLAITKTATAGPRTVGVPSWYVITIRNVGKVPAYDVVVRDRLPAGLAFAAKPRYGAIRGNLYELRLVKPLPVGGVRTVRLMVVGDATIARSAILAKNCRTNFAFVSAADFPWLRAPARKCWLKPPVVIPPSTG